MTPNELYILYGFLAFICLLLVTIVGILIRQSFDIGKIQGQLTALIGRVNGLDSRVERLEQQMANFREPLGEARGLMRSLHDRMDQLMRHHHNDAGQVVIVPAEEVAAAD